MVFWKKFFVKIVIMREVLGWFSDYYRSEDNEVIVLLFFYKVGIVYLVLKTFLVIKEFFRLFFLVIRFVNS